MSWAEYNNYDQIGHTASYKGAAPVVALAFKNNNANKLAAPGLIILANNNKATGKTGDSDETGSAEGTETETQVLNNDATVAERIKTLWNMNKFGAATRLLTKTLYERENVNKEVLELSVEMLKETQNNPDLNDLTPSISLALQEYHSDTQDMKLTALSVAIVKFENDLIKGNDYTQSGLNLQKTLEDTFKSTPHPAQDLEEQLEQALSGSAINPNDMSKERDLVDIRNGKATKGKSGAQITAMLAAAESLEEWTKTFKKNNEPKRREEMLGLFFRDLSMN